VKELKESLLVIGQVFDLLIGDDFTTPTLEVIEQYPYLRFGV
jgi:hypothetical protein